MTQPAIILLTQGTENPAEWPAEGRITFFSKTDNVLYSIDSDGVVTSIGEQGVQGIQGIQGVVGPQGDTGPQGIQGVTGNTGATGSQGVVGPPGADGTSVQFKGTVELVVDLPGSGNDLGDAYIVTEDGNLWSWNGTIWVDLGQIVGPQGEAGPTGPTGSQGIQGIQGVTGNTGSTGAQGETGLTGAQGIQGIQGVTGLTGAQGIQGEIGLTGTTGATGATGADSTVPGPAGPLNTAGGTTGQILAKIDATDYNAEWVDQPVTSPLTTKGDLYTFDTVNQRLPVGTDGQILIADSAETTGIKWVANAGPAYFTYNEETGGLSYYAGDKDAPANISLIAAGSAISSAATAQITGGETGSGIGGPGGAKGGGAFSAGGSGGLAFLEGGGVNTGNGNGGNVKLDGGSVNGTGQAGHILISGGTQNGTGVAGRVRLSTNDVVRFDVNKDGTWSLGTAGTNVGTAGQVITSNGTGTPPTWQAAAGGSTTLTGDVTGTGTGSFATTLATTGVGAGTYSSVQVDTKGRVTAGAALSGDVTTSAGVATLANTAVTPGTYKSVTVDAKGRVTAASNPAASGGLDIVSYTFAGGL